MYDVTNGYLFTTAILARYIITIVDQTSCSPADELDKEQPKCRSSSLVVSESEVGPLSWNGSFRMLED